MDCETCVHDYEKVGKPEISELLGVYLICNGKKYMWADGTWHWTWASEEVGKHYASYAIAQATRDHFCPPEEPTEEPKYVPTERRDAERKVPIAEMKQRQRFRMNGGECACIAMPLGMVGMWYVYTTCPDFPNKTFRVYQAYSYSGIPIYDGIDHRKVTKEAEIVPHGAEWLVRRECGGRTEYLYCQMDGAAMEGWYLSPFGYGTPEQAQTALDAFNQSTGR